MKLTNSCLALSLFLTSCIVLIAQSQLASNWNFEGEENNVVWEYEQTIGILKFRGKELVGCQLILAENDRKENTKERILRNLSTSFSVEETDFDSMVSIVQSCNKLDTPPFKKSNTLPLTVWSLSRGIIPGTKWCGVNDIADNYYDLGEDILLDKCCRAHDHCPIKVKAFSRSYGETNFHPYTKSHCVCDQLLYDCLKALSLSNNKKATQLGHLFFNVLHLQCISPVYPVYCSKSLDSSGILEHHSPPSIISKSNSSRISNCVSWDTDTNVSPSFSATNSQLRF